MGAIQIGNTVYYFHNINLSQRDVESERQLANDLRNLYYEILKAYEKNKELKSKWKSSARSLYNKLLSFENHVNICGKYANEAKAVITEEIKRLEIADKKNRSISEEIKRYPGYNFSVIFTKGKSRRLSENEFVKSHEKQSNNQKVLLNRFKKAIKNIDLSIKLYNDLYNGKIKDFNQLIKITPKNTRIYGLEI